MKKQKRNIGDEIIQGLTEILEGKYARRTDFVPQNEVVKIRNSLELSQERMAALLGVSVATYRNWEQGRRQPRGAAASLLLVARKHPNAVLDALS